MSIYRQHISPSPRQLVFRELIDGITIIPFYILEANSIPKIVKWMIVEPKISDEDAEFIANRIYGQPCSQYTLPMIEKAWDTLEYSRVVAQWRDRLGEL